MNEKELLEKIEYMIKHNYPQVYLSVMPRWDELTDSWTIFREENQEVEVYTSFRKALEGM